MARRQLLAAEGGIPPSVIQVIGNVAVGGAERHLLDLVRGLRAREVAVEVICPRPGPLVELLRDEGVPVQCLELAFPRPGDEYALDWQTVQALQAIFVERQPALVHSHLYPAHLHASLAAHETHVPGVVQTAHTLVVRPGDVLLTRLTEVHTIATSGRVRHVLRRAGVPSARMDVIYNGVGAEHFANEVAPLDQLRASLALGDGPVFGTVARLSPEKNVGLLLEAARLVLSRLPTARVVVVGDGPELTTLRAQAASLGVASAVRFLGARADIAALNQLLDVFVLPSREEACPIALQEAMAGGGAVVATRVGGTPEVITHEHDGLLVPSDDAQTLGAALIALLRDAPRRRRLGEAARQTAAARFTLEQMIEQTLGVYRRVLESRGDGRGDRREASRARSA